MESHFIQRLVDETFDLNEKKGSKLVKFEFVEKWNGVYCESLKWFIPLTEEESTRLVTDYLYLDELKFYSSIIAEELNLSFSERIIMHLKDGKLSVLKQKSKNLKSAA